MSSGTSPAKPGCEPLAAQEYIRTPAESGGRPGGTAGPAFAQGWAGSGSLSRAVLWHLKYPVSAGDWFRGALGSQSLWTLRSLIKNGTAFAHNPSTSSCAL